MGKWSAPVLPASEGIGSGIGRRHVSSRAYCAPGNRCRRDIRQARLRFKTRESTNMSNLVQVTKNNDIAIITINNPPVNALSPGVPEGICEAIETIDKDDSIKAAVLIGAGRTFVAGADIKEFGKMTSGKGRRGAGMLPMLLQIEDCREPIVMAIHGTPLGGGLELAMAGHYRVAVASAQVGQPEVKLGIIPGAGGTQRLPPLAGVAAAVGMAADGNPISAEPAPKFGIL